MVIMSFRGCAKITCPLRWLLLLLGSECFITPSLWQTGPLDTLPQYPILQPGFQEKFGCCAKFKEGGKKIECDDVQVI